MDGNHVCNSPIAKLVSRKQGSAGQGEAALGQMGIDRLVPGMGQVRETRFKSEMLLGLWSEPVSGHLTGKNIICITVYVIIIVFTP